MTITQEQLNEIIASLNPAGRGVENTSPPVPLKSTVYGTCRACPEKLDPVLFDRADNTGLHVLCNDPAASATPAPAGAPCDDPFCGGTCGHPPAVHIAKPGTDVHVVNAIIADTPPPADPAPEAPASTVGYVRDILIRYGASRPRSLQTALGPSELGTPCQRQIGYKLAGTAKRPITDPEWASLQGVAIHALMEDALHYENGHLGRQRWVIEQRVHPDEIIAGNGDAFDTDTNCVVDWKYTGKTALGNLRAAKRAGKPPEEQVSPEYRVQAHLYGYGHERAGRTVQWVRLVLLARQWRYDDSDEWTEAYNPDIAIHALDRYYATVDLVNALNPQTDPAMWTVIPAAPSTDTCKWCNFRRNGGPADGTGCPGDYPARVERFADGLIIPT